MMIDVGFSIHKRYLTIAAMMWKIVIIRFAQLISLRKNDYNKKPKSNNYMDRTMFREKVCYF